MLRKLRYNYPDAEIWCCTLNLTYIPSHPDFASFPYLDKYCDVIKWICAKEQKEIRPGKGTLKLIDLYGLNTPYSAIDGSHPDKSGMNTLADTMIRAIQRQ